MTALEAASPDLTTGWETTLPPEDTELRRFVLAWSEYLAGPVVIHPDRSPVATASISLSVMSGRAKGRKGSVTG